MAHHQIDVATGAVAFDAADVGLPGGPLPLSFIRHYSTANLQHWGVLGPGWTHSFDQRLEKTLEGWTFTDERGVRTQIVGSTPGIETIEVCTDVDADPEPNFVMLRRFTSGNPNLWLCFARYAHGFRLVELQTTKAQRIVVRHRDVSSALIAEVEHVRSGRKLRFEYSPTDLLEATSVMLSDGSVESVCAYVYDEVGRLRRVTDRLGLRSSITYNEWHAVTHLRHRGGASQSFEYDARLRCTHTHGAEGFEERFLTYDEGRRITTVKNRGGDAWVYHCNDHGQVVTEIAPDGGTTRRSYDDRGLLISHTGPLGNRTVRSYDEFGRLVSIVDPIRDRAWHLDYDKEHRLLAVKIPGGRTWRYEYEHGQLARTLGPHGYVWRYEWTPFGELCKVVDPHGGVAIRVHDSHGNVIETAAGGRCRRYVYDAWGRATAQIDEYTTIRTFDEVGRIVHVAHHPGIELDYIYDDAGHVIERRGPGGTVRAKWLPCGCLTELTRADGSTVALRWGDEPGQLLSLRDPCGKQIEWTYDAMGRVVSRRHFDGGTMRVAYDVAGNPIELTDDKGRKFIATYDADNNLLAWQSPSGECTDYAYDILDRLLRASRGGVELTFVRDAYGQVERERLFDGVDDVELVTHRSLSAVGQPTLLRIAHPENDYVVRWYRDPHGELCGIEHGRANARRDWEIVNDCGHETARRLEHHEVRSTYDAHGRLSTVEVVGDAGGHLFQAAYHYRKGHLVGTDEGFASQYFEVDDAGQLRRWTWQPRSPMFEDAQAVTLCRIYDPAGNCTAESLLAGQSESQHQSEHRGNVTERVWDPYRDEVVFFEHDSCGQLVARTTPRGTTTFEWSDEGLLLAAVVDGARWSYRYDPFGRRITKTAPDGRTWRYVWDRTRIVYIEDREGMRIEYVYRPHGASPIAFVTQGRVFHLVHRPQGAPVVVIDDKNNVRPYAAHLDPWQRPIGEVTTKPILGFPGQEGFLGSPGQVLDPETGLYYNVHRYYDPTAGKFISPDPVGLLGGLHEYGWVPNPMEWIDPLGLRYVSGGPMPWRPGENSRDRHGRPNLTDPDNRNVYLWKPEDGTGRDRRAADGKCLTVVDGVPDSALPLDKGFQPGDSPAFISGWGTDGVRTPRPEGFDVSNHQMGNWCHGEIQALHFLVQNDISGATVWVDRPPCSDCARDLDGILAAHFPGGDGRSVTIMYPDPDGGWETWEQYKSRKQPPCGG